MAPEHPEPPDHYFAARPASADERRLLTVDLAGRAVTVETAGGVFSPDHVDLGTRVLLRTVTPPEAGHVLDLGCGWGPVALSVALASPGATVWAVDVNERARDLTARNAARLGLDVRVAAPQDVPADVAFTAILSNPPIRIGKAALHELLTHWLARLAPGGAAELVVQRNLGADSLQVWLRQEGWAATRTASAKGFRVLHVPAREGTRGP